MLTSKLKGSTTPSLPAFPGLYQLQTGVSQGEVVLATGPRSGVVVLSVNPDYPVGFTYPTASVGLNISGSGHWKFLPAATIEFSSSPTS